MKALNCRIGKSYRVTKVKMLSKKDMSITRNIPPTKVYIDGEFAYSIFHPG